VRPSHLVIGDHKCERVDVDPVDVVGVTRAALEGLPPPENLTLFHEWVG
jgi:hypothetical protein